MWHFENAPDTHLIIVINNKIRIFDEKHKLSFMEYGTYIKSQLTEAADVLQRFSQDEKALNSVYQAAKLISTAFDSGKKVFSCGNGGSMSDAMHFAEELTGNYRRKRKALPAMAISDAGHLSCTANDFGYEYVFSRYIEAHGKEGDILLAISTSGNSENVINAAISAKEQGMQVIGLTGVEGGALSSYCDIVIRAPEANYADRIQEIHIKVIHIIIDLVEKMLGLSKT